MMSCLSGFCAFYLNKEILLFLALNSYQITLNNQNLPYFIFTNITEIFDVYIKIFFFLFTQLFFFSAVYHSFAFLSTALFSYEYVFLSKLFRITLWAWGVSLSLSNLIITPITWGYFSSFHGLLTEKFISLYFEAKLEECLRFYFYVYYFCIFYCQILLILLFIFTHLSNQFLQKFRKLYYYVFILISTLLSPPDVFIQILISFGTLFIYELVVLWFLLKSSISSVSN